MRTCRRRAREDKLQIQTGYRNGRVWALHVAGFDEEVEAAWGRSIGRALEIAPAMGHDPRVTRDGREGLLTSTRLGCRRYGFVAADTAGDVADGRILDVPCEQ